LLLFARLPFTYAAICTVILPYLILPEAVSISLPSLPDLSKTDVICIGLLFGVFLYRSKGKDLLAETESKGTSLKRLLIICLMMILGGFVLTVLNNTDPLRFGNTILPGTRPWDILGITFQTIIGLAPFWLSALYLAAPGAQRTLLVALVYAVLLYSLLILVEIRLSPQIHKWVYGYHQHQFIQHIRDGDYRPMVFLGHGLEVGYFIFMGLIAAIGLWLREKETKWLLTATWILGVLLISKNVGASIIGLFMAGVFLCFGQRLRIWAVSLIAIMVLVYPMLRQSNIVRTETMVSLASVVSPDRAGSLGFRLENEDLLLDRALEKPLTGWGGWGRSRIYDERGYDVSVTDGRWIIVLGQFGWIGYLGRFGFLVLPLIFLMAARRRKEIPIETTALALISAGNLIYILPNSTLSPVGLMTFGAVAGCCMRDVKPSQSSAPDTESTAKKTPRYTRFGAMRTRTLRNFNT
jgi:hypothetical protein